MTNRVGYVSEEDAMSTTLVNSMVKSEDRGV
jgi:hypothetical protein